MINTETIADQTEVARMLPTDGSCSQPVACLRSRLSRPFASLTAEAAGSQVDATIVSSLLVLLRKYTRVPAPALSIRAEGSTFALTCATAPDMTRDQHLRVVAAAMAELNKRPAPGTPMPVTYVLGGLDDTDLAGDLAIGRILDSDGIKLEVGYHEHVYSTALVERLLDHLIGLVEHGIQHPGALVGRTSLLSATEWEGWASFNATRRPYPRHSGIFGLFAAHARETPDRVAVYHGEEEVTYGRLLERSQRLAKVLKARGILPSDRVAFQLRKSPQLVVAMLAVLRVGAVYVPIDPEVPAARRDLLLNDSGAALLLVEDTSDAIGVEVLDLGVELNPGDVQDVQDLLEYTTLPGSPAYVMYTSGTTGRPKGVVVPQAAVVRLVRGCEYVELSPRTRILQTGAIAFDATTFEFWGALLNGGSVVLVDGETVLSASSLRDAIVRHAANTLFVTTGLFNQLIDEMPSVFDGCTVLFGGEEASPRHVALARASCSGSEFVHVYGPTENTTFSLFNPLTSDAERRVPIGRPISNCTAWILDQDSNPQPVGVQGELYVGGDGLATGYLNRPQLDAAAFSIHATLGERLYRTGDLVVMNPDWQIEFIGRADRQVKVRGYRIELGEIEFQLSQVKGVASVAVVPRVGADGATSLGGFFTGSSQLDLAHVRHQLSRKLPEYMVPTVLAQVDTLPLTINNKIDFAALLELWPAAERERSDSLTPMQARVAAIFTDVLEVSVADADADFFALGGHSLRTMRLQNRIRADLGLEIRLRQILEAPTVRAIAAVLEQAQPVPDSRPRLEKRP